ncbi:quercetin 2,3-dioxygenase [Microbacterium halophytorum]|uniref:quercetin 2,3-dioxygenase n=1 Tax=Microbacterium halophytorum TaxID=2067568 RepID=UPI000CFD64F6|nr:quercetin 2,3-dioxygenase [Microbacterium halophytorum]
MTTNHIEDIQGLAPVLNALPGESVPYYIAAGEGPRYETAGMMWNVVARSQDTGGLFDAAFIHGGRGTDVPFHSLPAHQRSYYVFEGSAQFWIPGESRVLVPGDSVHVPAGVPVAFRLLGNLTKLFLYSAPGGALDALLDAGEPVEHHVYSLRGDGSKTTRSGLVLPGAISDTDLERVASDDTTWDAHIPAGAEAYFLRHLEGDRRAWPDSINAYSSRGRTTGRRYFSVTTLATKQPYIIRHFHQQHTENFLCLSGRVWLWVNGEELLLTQGDFLHAPAGTVHSFAIASHNAQMLGVLTSDVFEPFFDVTGAETTDPVYTEGLIDPGQVLAGIQANPDLDLVVVGPPPERVRATGI